MYLPNFDMLSQLYKTFSKHKQWAGLELYCCVVILYLIIFDTLGDSLRAATRNINSDLDEPDFEGPDLVKW
jgi:hypothetical protein